jgi:hypothetical protein
VFHAAKLDGTQPVDYIAISLSANRILWNKRCTHSTWNVRCGAVLTSFPKAQPTVHEDFSGQARWFSWKYFQLFCEEAFNYVSRALHVLYFSIYEFQ